MARRHGTIGCIQRWEPNSSPPKAESGAATCVFFLSKSAAQLDAWLKRCETGETLPVSKDCTPKFSRYNRTSNFTGYKVGASDWERIQSLVESVLELEGVHGEETERERVRERLFDMLRPQLYRMIRALVPSADLAEDITQDAILHLWARLSIYDPKLAPFRAWVSRVVINFTYNAVRSHNKMMRHELHESDLVAPDLAEDSPPFLESATDPAPDPIDHAADRERLERILECAREALNPDEYLVWLHQVMHDAPYQEIATLMERNEAWARQTMLRARQKLAAAIILHPQIVSNEEIQHAIARCQRADEPLNEAELAVLKNALPPTGERKPPNWRQIKLFRQACYKLLPYLISMFFLVCSIMMSR